MSIDTLPQYDILRNAVPPIVDIDEGGLANLRGTAFIIPGNLALTAHHVIARAKHSLALLLVTPAGQWNEVYVDDFEAHPTEDVALLRLRSRPDGQPWWTPYQLCGDRFSLATPYVSFGYPEDLYHEVISEESPWLRPDLVYYEGYVHRRMSDVPLTSIRGSQFYEVSTVSGRGASGGPVLSKKHALGTWSVIGVYVGERPIPDPGVDPHGSSRAVGYVARLDAITDWTSQLLGGEQLVPDGAPRIGPQQI